MLEFDENTKSIIAEWNWDINNAYQCTIHKKICIRLKIDDDKKCGHPNCTGELIPIPNIKELQAQFKQELGKND